MKVEAFNINGIKLTPENESDKALLSYWSEQVAQVAGSAHGDGGLIDLLIEFKPREQKQ